jgi:hypothetical protein
MHPVHWPSSLNSLGSENGLLSINSMFQTEEQERGFWKHVQVCQDCLLKTMNELLLPYLPVDAPAEVIELYAACFDEEIDRYSKDIHPSDEVLLGADLRLVETTIEVAEGTNEANIDEEISAQEAQTYFQDAVSAVNVHIHCLVCISCTTKRIGLLQVLEKPILQQVVQRIEYMRSEEIRISNL